jgi:hypothetical protein
LESALDATARELGASGPDDLYGNGRIDILGAYQALASGSIGDLVFEDRDGDSTRDEGEPGLAGVPTRSTDWRPAATGWKSTWRRSRMAPSSRPATSHSI